MIGTGPWTTTPSRISHARFADSSTQARAVGWHGAAAERSTVGDGTGREVAGGAVVTGRGTGGADDAAGGVLAGAAAALLTGGASAAPAVG
ncbi:hypothetical protein, partial [Pseudonocardia asaccharolytica]|uniref:hypothetical protein n=1 Tax=Pseudonocardia asaccharolytica TaxID=54010 RepID=UPI0021BFE3E9